MIRIIDLNNTFSKYIQQKTQYLFFANILNTFLQTDKDVERQAYETYYFIYLFIWFVIGTVFSVAFEHYYVLHVIIYLIGKSLCMCSSNEYQHDWRNWKRYH